MSQYTYPYYPADTFQQPEPEHHKIKKITKTIEKYDAEGNYIGKEVIITEEDEYDKIIYPYSYRIEYGYTPDYDSGIVINNENSGTGRNSESFSTGISDNDEVSGNTVILTGNEQWSFTNSVQN